MQNAECSLVLFCHSPPPVLFVSVLGIILISVSAYHPLGFCFSNLFSFPLPPPPIVTASEDVQGNFWCSQSSNLRRPHISPLLLLLVKMCKAILDVFNLLIFTVPPSFPISLLLVKMHGQPDQPIRACRSIGERGPAMFHINQTNDSLQCFVLINTTFESYSMYV